MTALERYFAVLRGDDAEPPIGNPTPRRAAWWAWHRENPHFYKLFERFAFEAIRAGVGRTSAWLIVNRIRWETSIVTRGGDYKVSNDHIAYFARYFMLRHPEYDGLFVVKEMKL